MCVTGKEFFKRKERKKEWIYCYGCKQSWVEAGRSNYDINVPSVVSELKTPYGYKVKYRHSRIVCRTFHVTRMKGIWITVVMIVRVTINETKILIEVMDISSVNTCRPLWGKESIGGIEYSECRQLD